LKERLDSMADLGFPKILGTATLNEKGQIVIPADARANLGLTAGSKVVIMQSPQRPALIILPAAEVESMLQDLSDAINNDTQ
jgi:AbrB family looped-hinge helix DNA binding protein